MQASLLGVSLEAYVVDNDMLGNILRTLRGVEVNAENIGAEVIAEVCRGEGHYLGHRHTFTPDEIGLFLSPSGRPERPARLGSQRVKTDRRGCTGKNP